MSLPDRYQWDSKAKKFRFFGIDSILLWKKPSLYNILNPLIEQLGEGFYFLLVAYEAFESAKENFHYIVNQKGCDFEQGFANWADEVSTSGWGFISLKSIDWERKQATLEAEDPWELAIRQTQNMGDNLPMLCGKASGIFGLAMGCNMRAQVTGILEKNGRHHATIQISKSDATLKSELEALNKREGHSRYEHLQILNRTLQETQNELEEANRKLTELAIKDGLTGAYNRRYFMAQASQHHSYQIRYNLKASLIMLDIDHFKKINDNYGHQAGDLSLIEFTNICKNNIRDTDLFGRFGGEEFAISLPGLDLEHATQTAEKIRHLIEQMEVCYGEERLSFTVSIGVAEMQPDETLENALSRVDKALYLAKNSGRNKVVSA